MEPDLQADPLSAAARPIPGPSPAARREARVGLYVHVPFCARRCHYCDFSSGALAPRAVERYLAAIERECERRAPAAAGLEFTSVFFGGGTPSALSARSFGRLWAALASRFRLAPGAEITLEANPESVSEERLEAWAVAGVNRLSMGAQSFDPAELVRLGRVHAADRPAAAFARARAWGFRRLSLDLMFGFPGHSLERWRRTVETALALEPEHLSAYCFTPEAGTLLGEAVAHGALALPGDAEQAAAYAWLAERLAAAGYACYETSNFCRAGGEVRHNLVYWLRRTYVGLGPSAHGLLGGARYGNHYALDRWAAALEAGDEPEAEREPESETTVAQEVMMLGLRLADGLVAPDYPPAVWAAVGRRYGTAFSRALRAGRLEPTREGWRIPERLRFVADDVLAWLEAEAERPRRAGPRFDTRAELSVTSISCHNRHFQVA